MTDTNGPLLCDAWVATKLGDPTAVLERQQVEVPPPAPNEVRVAVEAFCLNFNDIDVIRGRYLTLPLEAPFVPGMESVGVVESVGEGQEHLLGQRIVAIPTMAHGGYATHAIVDAATALGIPAEMSSVDGAALHYPFHLGWFALHERARLQPGETLLVHAGAGGTGSGAVQIGKALGARVIATAGTDEKVDYCRAMGADHAINYRSSDFVAEVEELTYGRGVDVAFDAVGGDTTLQTFKCMGFGVYVNDPLGVRRMMGFNWPSRAEGQVAHAKILELLRTGVIRTAIGRQLTFDEIPEALESMERRETMGRLVVRL